MAEGLLGTIFPLRTLQLRLRFNYHFYKTIKQNRQYESKEIWRMDGFSSCNSCK